MSCRTFSLACLLGLTLTACTTEVRSLTHVRASLEARDGMGPFQVSHLARGDAPYPTTPAEAEVVDKLTIEFDGQAMLLDNGQPVTIATNSSMLGYFAPVGVGSFSFARDGDTLVTSEPLELSTDRFNYLIVHGDPNAPELLVLEGPREARRVRLANVRHDRADLEFALLDSDGMPLGDAMPLPYGASWSELVAADVDAVRVVGPDDTSIDVRVSCDPTAAMVAYDEPLATGEPDHPTPFIGLLAGGAKPGSAEEALSQCFDHDCECPELE